MEKWNEMRTAYKLAKLKTLSATALDMGVHRSTVMRHIDSLEDALGILLFQRNDKGYIATEAGLEVMRLGEVTQNQFSQLSARLLNQEQALTGKITITSVSEIAGLIMPVIAEYQSRYPKMRIEFIGDIRNFDLEYGEADIAIRAGDKPSTIDNIVLPLTDIPLTFCAHRTYIDKFGFPIKKELREHRFIGLNDRPPHLLWNEWIYNHISEENLAFLCSNQQILTRALMAGLGIGVLPKQVVTSMDDLFEIPSDNDWIISTWVLIHRDMYKMSKIKAFTDILSEQKNSLSFS